MVRPRARTRTRKVKGPCYFCQAKIEKIDYKGGSKLSRFVSSRGRILARSRTGVCAKHQRQLSRAIKNARIAALLPFTERHAL